MAQGCPTICVSVLPSDGGDEKSNEGNGCRESHEGHEGNEGQIRNRQGKEGKVCSVQGQQGEDRQRPEEVRLAKEQEGKDCEQEGQCRGKEEVCRRQGLDSGSGGSKNGSRPEGLCR